MINQRTKAEDILSSERHRNDGGAVLLLGLLFAVVSIGFIWIIFGLGDTMVRREHANGAADSIALSVAVQHARMMNFVVLLNFIMSAILTVRVVLRVLEAAVVIAAIPTLGLSLAALPPLRAIDSASSPGILAALSAIGLGAGMMILTVPGIAHGTANYISDNYRPVVTRGIATSAGQDAYGAVFGLPLEQDKWGNTECKKTASFATDLLKFPLDKIGAGFLVDFAAKPIRQILGGGSLYFCGIGYNFEPPEKIQEQIQKLHEKIEEDCRKELKADGTDPTTPQGQIQFKLCVVKYQGPLQAAQDTIQDFANEGLNGLFGLTPPTTFMTTDQYTNGSKQWAVMAVAVMDDAPMKDARLVDTAGFGKRKVGELPPDAARAVAQAEFYFDCTERWKEEGCDAPHEPMWNFRWKSRLVPVFAESPTLKEIMTSMAPSINREYDAAGKGSVIEVLKGMSIRVRH